MHIMHRGITYRLDAEEQLIQWIGVRNAEDVEQFLATLPRVDALKIVTLRKAS